MYIAGARRFFGHLRQRLQPPFSFQKNNVIPAVLLVWLRVGGRRVDANISIVRLSPVPSTTY